MVQYKIAVVGLGYVGLPVLPGTCIIMPEKISN
jgi:UDP-N-acetyl-D-mannosaminuronate dehydrogenase